MNIPESNKLAKLAPLLPRSEDPLPSNGTGILHLPGARIALVVEAGEVVQLGVGEQPEAEQGAREARVHGARGHLDQRGQGLRQLAELLLEGGREARRG